MSDVSLKSVLLQDFWIHLAGLTAIALGAADLWYFHAFAHDSDLLFIVGGFGAMGLKIINGSAEAMRTAALNTAFAASRAANSAAAAATSSAAAAASSAPPTAATPPGGTSA